MKTYRVKQVDAFTSVPFRGNFAGVVPAADGLTDAQMQLIAREMNVSETAFVLAPTQKNADIQIRWFTPTSEVDLCGHATVAAFHGLAEDGLAGMKTEGQHLFRVQTKSGVLNVRVEKNFYNIVVEMELPVPRFRKKKSVPASIAKALGLKARDQSPDLPVVADSDLFIPLKTIASLKSLSPAFGALRDASGSTGYRGICLFTKETVDKTSSFHSRFFAPAFGIDEDPVTGSANGPLGVYMHQFVPGSEASLHARELSDGRVEYVGEQGDFMGRQGRVKVRVTPGPKGVERVAIAGEAFTVLESTLRF